MCRSPKSVKTTPFHVINKTLKINFAFPRTPYHLTTILKNKPNLIQKSNHQNDTELCSIQFPNKDQNNQAPIEFTTSFKTITIECTIRENYFPMMCLMLQTNKQCFDFNVFTNRNAQNPFALPNAHLQKAVLRSSWDWSCPNFRIPIS